MSGDASESLYSLVSRLAAHLCDRNALMSPSKLPLSFQALPGRLEEIRAQLAVCGVGPGDRVAVVVPRGPEMALCFLGVAACATFLPLNPSFARTEFAEHFSRLQPSRLIVSKEGGEAARISASELGIEIIELNSDPAGVAGSFTLTARSGLAPVAPRWNSGDDFALILMTSGSTARAKLVPLRLRHLTSYAERARKHLRICPDDRFLHVMPMFHGHGLKSSILNPILAGCGVVCPTDFTIDGFFKNLVEYDITWYSAGYAIHQAIFDRLDDYREIAAASRLRLIRSGSGKLNPVVQEGMEAAFGTLMIERYGMSECGTLASNGFTPETRRKGTVGQAVGASVAIMAADGGILGPNEEGEIVARGPSVFDGYLDDDALNAASFADGWFRTGDLGIIDADGFLTITGRVKDTINRGGEKISPLEVEKVISGYPDVAEVCVFSIPHSALGNEIGAAIVPAGGCEIDLDSLSDFVESRLALFKVPRKFIVMDALPKGDTGKVQRDAVAEKAIDFIEKAQSLQVLPAPHLLVLEKRITAIWRSVLNRNDIPPTIDFFLAGGDSLKAAEMMITIMDEFDVDFALARIFGKDSTVRRMAELVDRAMRSTAAPGRPANGVIPIKDSGSWYPLFVVPAHAGLSSELRYLAQVIAPEQPIYGLDFRGLRGREAPLDRMDEIVGDLIEKIRSVQPCGPYFLAGLCFGGRVAFAIAQRLTEQGEHVARLIMLDPSAPLRNSSGEARGIGNASRKVHHSAYVLRYLFQKAKEHIRSFKEQKSPLQRFDYIRKKAFIIRDIIARRQFFRGNRIELNRPAVAEANKIAGQNYAPVQAYAGKTIIFFPKNRTDQHAIRDRDEWMLFLSRPLVREVLGKSSGSMIRPPHVFALAKELNLMLTSAQQELFCRPANTTDGGDSACAQTKEPLPAGVSR